MVQGSSTTSGSNTISARNINIDGRAVLQPNSCNNNNNTTTNHPLLDRRNSLKKKPPIVLLDHHHHQQQQQYLSSSPTYKTTTTPPISPNINHNKSPRHDQPGSIAAARREEVAMMQVHRKMRIAHYGRTKSAKYRPHHLHHHAAGAKIVPLSLIDRDQDNNNNNNNNNNNKCFFITPNSDPIYVAYHDEEWGVPAHDDKQLFELLALTGAQVGSDWTSVLKKRQHFRDAFSGFDPEIVSKYSEKKINSISMDYAIQLSLVRGVVDNSKRILEVKREFGSLDKYLWGFVNNKSIETQYKSWHKIPVKTSKSESISKDMVRRGFRLVGPTVIHSFMQAAGLTNDHLVTCPRRHPHPHHQCVPPPTPLSNPLLLL